MIDAHQHFLDPGRVDYPWMTGPYERLRRTFLPGDLLPALDAAGVDRTIAVQASNGLDETHMLLRIAATDPRSAGVVGWVDLIDPALGTCARRARGRGSSGSATGHDEPDPRWLPGPRSGRA